MKSDRVRRLNRCFKRALEEGLPAIRDEHRQSCPETNASDQFQKISWPRNRELVSRHLIATRSNRSPSFQGELFVVSLPVHHDKANGPTVRCCHLPLSHKLHIASRPIAPPGDGNDQRQHGCHDPSPASAFRLCRFVSHSADNPTCGHRTTDLTPDASVPGRFQSRQLRRSDTT
jgi:hypothetical protein